MTTATTSNQTPPNYRLGLSTIAVLGICATALMFCSRIVLPDEPTAGAIIGTLSALPLWAWIWPVIIFGWGGFLTYAALAGISPRLRRFVAPVAILATLALVPAVMPPHGPVSAAAIEAAQGARFNAEGDAHANWELAVCPRRARWTASSDGSEMLYCRDKTDTERRAASAIGRRAFVDTLASRLGLHADQIDLAFPDEWIRDVKDARDQANLILTGNP